MQNDEAVIKPLKTKNSPKIGPLAAMVATWPDLDQLCKLLNFNPAGSQQLFLSQLFVDGKKSGDCSVVGPFVGAPYAVMLLENLIAWGAQQIIFIGWCGAISTEVKIGDLILPTAGLIDEGTSKHYEIVDADQVPATFPLVARLRQLLENGNCPFHEGTIWTTDAIYRETRPEVAAHRDNGILAVDMETSALFSAAHFREVDLAGILVVSDELSSLNWRPGFKQQRFKDMRKAACRLVADVLCNADLAKQH